MHVFGAKQQRNTIMLSSKPVCVRDFMHLKLSVPHYKRLVDVSSTMGFCVTPSDGVER